MSAHPPSHPPGQAPRSPTRRTAKRPVRSTDADTARPAAEDPIAYLHGAARMLHRAAQSGQAAACARLRVEPALRSLDDAALRSAVQRRHCLAVIAHELGFDSWPHTRHILGGGGDPSDPFGTLLYPAHGSAYWNIWSADYAEARAIRDQHGGYLLAYRRHYFIVESHFIAAIGLSPDDPDWDRIGRDWVRPGDAAARGRLYRKLLQARMSAP